MPESTYRYQGKDYQFVNQRNGYTAYRHYVSPPGPPGQVAIQEIVVRPDETVQNNVDLATEWVTISNGG